MIPPQRPCPSVYSTILNTGAALPIWRILKEPSVPEPVGERRDGSAKALQLLKKTAALDIGVCLRYRNGLILTETIGVSGFFKGKKQMEVRKRERKREGKGSKIKTDGEKGKLAGSVKGISWRDIQGISSNLYNAFYRFSGIESHSLILLNTQTSADPLVCRQKCPRNVWTSQKLVVDH